MLLKTTIIMLFFSRSVIIVSLNDQSRERLMISFFFLLYADPLLWKPAGVTLPGPYQINFTFFFFWQKYIVSSAKVPYHQVLEDILIVLLV